MSSDANRRRIDWCSVLPTPCPVGLHPRVSEINQSIADAPEEDVARFYHISVQAVRTHVVEGHHLAYQDSSYYQTREENNTQQAADRTNLTENLEELVKKPHKYYIIQQKILTRELIRLLSDTRDITKITREIRDTFKAMSELPVNEETEVNVQEEYDYFFNLVTMELCPKCQIKVLDKMEEKADVKEEKEAEEKLEVVTKRDEVKKVRVRSRMDDHLSHLANRNRNQDR